MSARRSASFLIAAVVVVSGLVGQGAHAASLGRADQPVVLTGAQVPGVQGLAPGEVVGFSYVNGSWVQIPIQVDQMKVFNIRNAYPNPMPLPCGDPCYTPGNQTWWERVYADPNTLTGAEKDETLSIVSGPLCSGVGDEDLGNVPLACTVSNHATIDADDEIALARNDVGAQAPSGADAPAGALGNGVEIRLADSIDGGTGFVYLFRRDPGAAQVLTQDAGTSYVAYSWVVDSIQANHPGDPLATQHFYKSEYRFNGMTGTAHTGNPESSSVETASYRREMTGRWSDNVLVNKRGADAANILKRHDASITTDNLSACTRWQGTFDSGEMAYLTSYAGPIRAIRDYLGTNSGPLVERRQIYYASSEWERIDLRVHPVPGPTEVWDWNANATGMRYSTMLGSDRIDHAGVPAGGFVGAPGSGTTAGTYVGFPAIAPKTYNWETVDRDTTNDPARGGLTFTVYFDSNNPDPFAHSLYRDSGNGGCNNTPYYGAILDQAPAVMDSTDADWTGLEAHGATPGVQGTQQSFLTIVRNLHYETTGGANGPKRTSEDSTPLSVTTTQR